MRDKKIDEIAASLKSDPKAKRREAANTLRELGMRSRTSLEKRGSLSSPAPSPISDNEEVMEALKSAISDSDSEVRLHAVDSAAHIGDATSVEALRTRLQDDRPEIKLATIEALGEIGGLSSLQALADVVGSEKETEQVRLAALSALEELSAKQITSGPDRRFNPAEYTLDPEAVVETDTLGQAKTILIDTLEKVASDERQADLFRLKAHEILAYLRSGAAAEE
jgi:hypothetical protein